MCTLPATLSAAIDADYIPGASHWLDRRSEWMASDGLHNDQGYQAMANRMDAELEKPGLSSNLDLAPRFHKVVAAEGEGFLNRTESSRLRTDSGTVALKTRNCATLVAGGARGTQGQTR